MPRRPRPDAEQLGIESVLGGELDPGRPAGADFIAEHAALIQRLDPLLGEGVIRDEPLPDTPDTV